MRGVRTMISVRLALKRRASVALNTKRRQGEGEGGNSFSQQAVTGNLFDRSVVPTPVCSPFDSLRGETLRRFTGFRRSTTAAPSLQLISIAPMINAFAEISSWYIYGIQSNQYFFLLLRFTFGYYVTFTV